MNNFEEATDQAGPSTDRREDDREDKATRPRSGIASWYHEEDVRQPTNRLATAGAILSFVPMLGLVLSIIGLSNARSARGVGRKAAGFGIALSLVFMTVYGLGVYKVAESTAMDPACLAADSTAASMSDRLNADVQAISSDFANPAQSSDFMTAEDDIDNLKSALDADTGKATHADVKADIQALDSDLGSLAEDYQKLSDGDSSGLTDFQNQQSQLLWDAGALDNVCGDLTDG